MKSNRRLDVSNLGSLRRSSRGYYQIEGQPAVEMNSGDIKFIPAGVKHWHGAAPGSWFSHLAFEVPGENCRNEWLEPVDADYYNNLK